MFFSSSLCAYMCKWDVLVSNSPLPEPDCFGLTMLIRTIITLQWLFLAYRMFGSDNWLEHFEEAATRKGACITATLAFLTCQRKRVVFAGRINSVRLVVSALPFPSMRSAHCHVKYFWMKVGFELWHWIHWCVTCWGYFNDCWNFHWTL